MGRKEKSLEHPDPWEVKIIRWGVLLALLTPLVVSLEFYFPFIAPKSLYFMGISQILFFIWLFLAINYKRYRPSWNSVVLALILFLVILILSSVLGIDFSRSFWSKYERMTGVLLWLHLLGFFLVISSTFKKISDWKKIFRFSVLVAMIVSLMEILGIAGVSSLRLSSRGGATLGNTSFLGSYLLFNFFLGTWLGIKSKDWRWRVIYVFGAALIVGAIYLSKANAALLSAVGGIGLVGLLFFCFKAKNPKVRILGKAVLIGGVAVVLAGIALLMASGSIVQKKFVELTNWGRVINWNIAQKGFWESPLLGWGPENYSLVFTRFFHPCLFTPKCGGEIWFDRAHNIIFDKLVTVGILGLISYLLIFGAFLYILKRSYFDKKDIDFWTFAIFLTIPLAYFIQNLTVFDMIASLMMFILILGFGAFIANKGKEKSSKELTIDRRWVAIPLILVFLVSFLEFVIWPIKSNTLVIDSVQATNSQERIRRVKKALAISPMGKYQIREFMAHRSEVLITRNADKIPPGQAKKELDFWVNELEKTQRESPLDFKSTLRLAKLYNAYRAIGFSKLDLAEKYGRRALDLSPKNQQAYWTLAETKFYQKDPKEALDLAWKAINLEPNLLKSYQVAVQIAKASGKDQLAQDMAQQAVSQNPQWKAAFKKLLQSK